MYLPEINEPIEKIKYLFNLKQEIILFFNFDWS